MPERDPKKDVMETRAQPDPFVREGRSSTAWIFIVTAIAIAAIAVTLVVTTHNPQTAQNQAAHNTPLPNGPSAKATQPALPAGRTGNTPAPCATTTGSH